MENKLNLSNKQSTTIIWTLLMVMPLLGMTIDLIAPSLPAISSQLNISDSLAKETFTTFLFGFAFGNFFAGFISDAYGRRNILRIGLFLFSVISIVPVLFPEINVLLASRFIQGITMGMSAIVVRAAFSDIVPKDKLVHLGAVIGMMWGLGPVIGPLIGSYLQENFGWQSCFYFFSIVSLLNFISVFFIVPETHFNRQPLKFKTIQRNMLEVLKSRTFIALPIMMGMSYSLILSFHTMAPFFIQEMLHHSPVFFGKIALLLGVGYVITTIVVKKLLRHFLASQILSISIIFFLAAAIIGLILSYFYPNSVTLLVIISLMMFIASGFIFLLSLGSGLAMFGHIIGTATAIMYLINGGLNATISFIVSLTHINNLTTIIWVYVLLMSAITIVYFYLYKPQKST
ncbi:MAG: Bcr/CflA family efflux MFS transporter [Burkholderiales bacterium]|nr:Bcr/CflA family efflux MFS transporter [Burkholderiales bacterium]